MPCPVVHFEIGCKDPKKTQDFYSKLFDWKMQSAGPATMIAAEPSGIDGHITALGHEPFHYTTFYVQVDDVATYLAKAASLGGKTSCRPSIFPPAHSPGCRTQKATPSACGSRNRKRALRVSGN